MILRAAQRPLSVGYSVVEVLEDIVQRFRFRNVCDGKDV